MRFTNKEVLIFDLDGTLVDSVPDLALSINQMLAKLNMATYPIETIRSWVGNGAAVLTQRALSGSIDICPDLDQSLAEKALSIFLDYYNQNVCVGTCLYPHVKQSLEKLNENGFRLAIVTNKPKPFVQPILEKFGIQDLFELVIGGECLPRRKPDPIQLEYTCEKLSVEASRCVMIGDSKNDIFAAKAANMESIGLTYGYNHGEDIKSQGASMVFDDFADIVSSLAPKAANAS